MIPLGNPRTLSAIPGFGFDSQAGNWLGFEIESIPHVYRNAIRVFDGGLGCFVPCKLGEDHRLVLVCNLLTGEWKQLSLSHLVGNQPQMAQLRVNREKVTYKVIVVGHVAVAVDLKHRWEDNNPLAAEVMTRKRRDHMIISLLSTARLH